MTDTRPTCLSARDYCLLGALSLALFLISPLFGKTLTGHESVLAQNSREMLADGDWLVPKVGGQPWLERPPVPDWFICGVYAIAGTSANDSVARLAAILVAIPIVLLVANTAALFYGRASGLMAGGIFATMHEMYSYASNPEADIFLCLIVTATVAVFARLEFGARANREGESSSFFGSRPWMVVGFFALLGGTNLAKGLIFGTMMAGLPVAGYLMWNRSWGQMKRYVWFWGWLVALGVALAWPVAMIANYPEILQLWKEHYFGRLNKGYLAEPWWYYAVNVPYVLLPWTLPAIIGLWQTRKAAFAGPGPERFLWCWAILPPMVFSLSDGKHHHYLLQCMAPWAILSVGGASAIWRFFRARLPQRWQTPWPATILLGGTLAALLFAYRVKIGGPEWLVPVSASAMFVLAFVLARSVIHPNPRIAFGGVLLVISAAYAIWTSYIGAYRDSYRHDTVMLHQAAEIVPSDSMLYVHYDWAKPLETFWVLYHTPRPGTLIRDAWELHEKSGGRGEVFVLARRMDAATFARFGTVEAVIESEKTRLEPSAEYRRVLYRITLHDSIPPPPPQLLAHTRRTLW
ncbi:MAG: glycosyltransferase family 39 protein [Planctomycetia bacterium]|nr:glycosyltransferase family 39 protein [Planctomycetia bacterium]